MFILQQAETQLPHSAALLVCNQVLLPRSMQLLPQMQRQLLLVKKPSQL